MNRFRGLCDVLVKISFTFGMPGPVRSVKGAPNWLLLRNIAVLRGQQIYKQSAPNRIRVRYKRQPMSRTQWKMSEGRTIPYPDPPKTNAIHKHSTEMESPAHGRVQLATTDPERLDDPGSTTASGPTRPLSRAFSFLRARQSVAGSGSWSWVNPSGNRMAGSGRLAVNDRDSTYFLLPPWVILTV